MAYYLGYFFLIIGIIFLYHFLFPALWNGFTPGKRLVKIKIVRQDREKVNLLTSLMRCIGYHLDFLAFYGLTSAILIETRKDKRSLHDLISGTMVVQLEKVERKKLNKPIVENPADLRFRIGAKLLDGFIISIPLTIIILVSIIYGFYKIVENKAQPDPMIFLWSYLVIIGVVVITHLLYQVLVPTFWNGYTIGKKAVKIRIIRLDGQKVGLGTMLLRGFVGYLVDQLALNGLVSFYLVATNKDGRSLPDLIAGTYVKNMRA